MDRATPENETSPLHEERRPQSPFLLDALAGLRADPKTIPSKWLCDARGSLLFDRITELDEFPTRVERGILYRHAAEMSLELGEHCRLVEFGSGSSLKTRILLAAMDSSSVYVPVANTREALVPAAIRLAISYPWLEIHPVVADFTQPFALPESLAKVDTTAVFYPGSAIGNFPPEAAVALLANARELVGDGGAMLLGADLKKDPRILLRAWDDPGRVAAQFNLNLLRRMNRELAADFDPTAFAHRVLWNEEEGRVEMHLQSHREQTVGVGGEAIHFRRGETIFTAGMWKYEIAELEAMARIAGFEVEHVWTDPKKWFAMLLLRAKPEEAAPV